jgi:hypothetical protein
MAANFPSLLYHGNNHVIDAHRPCCCAGANQVNADCPKPPGTLPRSPVEQESSPRRMLPKRTERSETLVFFNGSFTINFRLKDGREESTSAGFAARRG